MSRFGTFYEWIDQVDEATVSFYIPDGKSTKDIVVEVKNDTIRAGIKGQPPMVEGKLYAPVTDSLWTILEQKVSIDLEKKRKVAWPLLIRAPLDMANSQTEHIDAQSQYELAMALIKGIPSIAQDLRQGLHNLLAAAHKGALLAQKEVASVYLGENKQFVDIVKVDAEKGLEFLKMADKQWHDPESQLRIGHVYYNGVGTVEQDLYIAEEWYNKAAKQTLPIAIYHLGIVAYKRGEYGIAITQWERASELNCAEASLCLCGVYVDGKVVERDLEKAKFYLLNVKRTPSNEGQIAIFEERIKELKLIALRNKQKESAALSSKAVMMPVEEEDDALSPLATVGLIGGAAIAIVGFFFMRHYFPTPGPPRAH